MTWYFDPTIAAIDGGAGAANFVGAATISFAAAADLKAGSALAGATTITFTPLADLKAGAIFVGATTVTFGVTADLKAGTALAGATTIIFTPTGDFVAAGGAGAANFVGAASITFDATATLASSSILAGATTITFNATGDFSNGGAAASNRGDDVKIHRGVRPLPYIRPKVERDLDEALEIVETIAPERRVKENKNAAKEALALVRETQIPISFEEPIAKIEKALKQLSLKTAKHEGMQEGAMRVAAELEAVIAEMERRRKRRKRDEEAILWLIN